MELQQDISKDLLKTISTLIAYFKRDEINLAKIDLPKVFYETVKAEYLKSGYEVIKEIFPHSTPKMLDTNYAAFWFFCIDYTCKTEMENNEKKKFLESLSELFVYVHINSIIRKHVPYNFDYNIWWEAVQRSKSRYLKKGGLSLLVNIMKENTTYRLLFGPYKNYCENKKLYVKSYYMLRHKISQILKPILEIYYALIEIKKKHKTVNDKLSGADITESGTVREFIVWFDDIVEQKELIQKVKNKKCLKAVYTYLFKLRELSLSEKEHIIKYSLRKVFEENFWKEDPVMVKIYDDTLDFKNFIKCFITLINEIYDLYTTYLHQKSMQNLILLYLLREI